MSGCRGPRWLRPGRYQRWRNVAGDVNGVVLRLGPKREGLMLTLGGGAMEISFR
ncbi:hypothetical protein HMPREF9946_03248 [Acetobacteraceae bacterium AT-5844]|nr:hypothetical protein HMPREF9946_03248 [Acetobacteraceae bacterium AT-5844]